MSTKDMPSADIKGELVAKLKAIQEISIPDSVAGKSTEKVRSSIQTFCAAMQAYIDRFDDRVCSGFDDNSDEEKQCLLEEIAKYGITIEDDFHDNGKLRNILNALHSFGGMIMECLDGLRSRAPSPGYPLAGGPAGYLYAGTSPASAFKLAFFPFDGRGNNSEKRPIKMTPYGTTYFAQTLAYGQTNPGEGVGPNNLIDRFTIELPSSTFAPGDDTVIERNIRHEFAHVLIDLVNEARGYEKTTYDGGYHEYTLRVEYLDVFPGENWNQDAFYNPKIVITDDSGKMYIEVDGKPIEIPSGIADTIQETYYFNATRQVRNVPADPRDPTKKANSSPDEDLADTIALYPNLPPALPLNPEEAGQATAEQIIANSPRVRFLENNFCCWVYELLGLNLEILGCKKQRRYRDTAPIP